MSRVIPRSEWGARFKDGFGYRPIAGINEIWLHHSVTTSPGPQADQAQDALSVRVLESIGQARFGGGISYTYAVTQAGRVFQGHSLNRIGAHTGGRNTRSVGVCIIGNYQNQAPTVPQQEALVWLLDYLDGATSVGQFTGGHRDVSSTACPGDQAYALIGNLNARAIDLDPVDNPITTPTPTPPAPVKPAHWIEEDGLWGRATNMLLQLRAGTVQDGELWGQYGPNAQPAFVDGWVYNYPNPKGSPAWRWAQGRLGTTQDGVFGQADLRALEARAGFPYDGRLDKPSGTVKWFQHALNTGTF